MGDVCFHMGASSRAFSEDLKALAVYMPCFLKGDVMSYIRCIYESNGSRRLIYPAQCDWLFENSWTCVMLLPMLMSKSLAL
jgi:hypothetical protein